MSKPRPFWAMKNDYPPPHDRVYFPMSPDGTRFPRRGTLASLSVGYWDWKAATGVEMASKDIVRVLVRIVRDPEGPWLLIRHEAGEGRDVNVHRAECVSLLSPVARLCQTWFRELTGAAVPRKEARVRFVVKLLRRRKL